MSGCAIPGVSDNTVTAEYKRIRAKNAQDLGGTRRKRKRRRRTRRRRRGRRRMVVG